MAKERIFLIVVKGDTAYFGVDSPKIRERASQVSVNGKAYLYSALNSVELLDFVKYDFPDVRHLKQFTRTFKPCKKQINL